MRLVRLAHHQREPELPAAFLREREAYQSPPIARHEIHVLGADPLGGHDEVALVLAILVIHDDGHLALAQIREDLVDRVHRSFLLFMS